MLNQEIESNLYELLFFLKDSSGIHYAYDELSGFVGVSHDSSAWPFMTVNIKKDARESDIDALLGLNKREFPTLTILGDDTSHHEDSLNEMSYRKISMWANMYIDSTISIDVSDNIKVKEIADDNLDTWKELVEDVLFQKKGLDKQLFTKGVKENKFKLFGAYTDENKLVGTLMVFFGSLPGVYMVATHKDYRKMGVASNLVSTAIRHIQDLGCPYMVLHSTAAGLPFYQKIGFRTTGNLSLYYYMNK